MDVRAGLVKQFDLFNIEDLRKQIRCREGLLIDYDYATNLINSEEASKETTVEEGESEGSEVKEGSQNPSDDRTVGFLFDTCPYLLRHFAGYSSFHCNGITYLWHPSLCCA
jgi:hypothetical protein